MNAKRLKVGVSACMMHEDRNVRLNIFNGKPLFYAEKSMMGYVLGAGAIPFLVPVPDAAPKSSPTVTASMDEIVSELDAIIIVGGVDMSPSSYGETPLKPEWSGDAVRDQYEMALIRSAMKLNRPVLGICRGHQVLNVTLGGTLYQDITTLVKGALVHRDQSSYDQNTHLLKILPESDLARIYPHSGPITINTVHHQAIKVLGKDLVVEAVCPDDGIIEAVRLKSDDLYIRSVQWHPEFSTLLPNQLEPWSLIKDFLNAAEIRRNERK